MVKTIVVFGATGLQGKYCIEVSLVSESSTPWDTPWDLYHTIAKYNTLHETRAHAQKLATYNIPTVDYRVIALTRSPTSSTSKHLASLAGVEILQVADDCMENPTPVFEQLQTKFGIGKGGVDGVLSVQGYVDDKMMVKQGGLFPRLPPRAALGVDAQGRRLRMRVKLGVWGIWFIRARILEAWTTVGSRREFLVSPLSRLGPALEREKGGRPKSGRITSRLDATSPPRLPSAHRLTSQIRSEAHGREPHPLALTAPHLPPSGAIHGELPPHVCLHVQARPHGGDALYILRAPGAQTPVDRCAGYRRRWGAGVRQGAGVDGGGGQAGGVGGDDGGDRSRVQGGEWRGGRATR